MEEVQVNEIEELQDLVKLVWTSRGRNAFGLRTRFDEIVRLLFSVHCVVFEK
jgi:hypothetical protein